MEEEKGFAAVVAAISSGVTLLVREFFGSLARKFKKKERDEDHRKVVLGLEGVIRQYKELLAEVRTLAEDVRCKFESLQEEHAECRADLSAERVARLSLAKELEAVKMDLASLKSN